ncbi:MAG: aldose 1-epimerase family protein [Firmicutes bacterium]|nr:aldose 1-epimerase family protein [Bacillota bacterium]
MHFIENEFLKVGSIEHGAELVHVIFKESGKDFLWQKGDLWQRQSPVLFPVVGNLKDDKLNVGKKSFNMTSHGFARDMEFSIIKKDTTSITYLLTQNEQTHKIYPYNFNLYVTYTLKRHTLDVNFEIENTQDTKMYFSIGAQPAFNCNVEYGAFSDYFIEFEKEETAEIYRKKDLLETKGTLFLKNANILELNTGIFKNGALIFKNLKSTFIRLKSKVSENYVKVCFKDFPTLIIWSKGDKFVALGPCLGRDDSVNFSGDISKKDQIIELAGGEVFDKSFQIIVK